MTAPPPPSPEKRALIDAYQDVLKADAERRDLDHRPTRPTRTRPFAWVALVLALVGAGVIWFAHPDWLGLAPAPAEPPAVREASLRLAVALEAQRVIRYQREHGRLPATLAEAGAVMPGVSYQPSREGIFELNAADADIAVIYRSTGSLRAFVGNSYDVVRGRGK